jgi:hypothetical protein
MNYYDYYSKKYMPGKATETEDRRRILSHLNLVVLTLMLGGFGLLSFILPKKSISELEKRKLAAMPSFSLAKMFEGTYMKDVDLYFADNFPLREGFVQMAFWMRDSRGFHSSDITLYLDDAPEDTSSAGDSLSVKKDSLAFADSLAADTLVDDADVNLANKGLLIVNSRALQIFGGSKKTARRYYDMLNHYKNTLSPDIHVFSIVAPSPTAFYLPSNHKKLSNDEPSNIKDIYANLNASIRTVDAYAEISAHKKEYLYFRTDHHWTGLGAYYAYKAFCKTSGFTPLALDSMEKKTIPDFLGTLYSKTRDKTLKDSLDYVDYWIIPGKYTCWFYTKKNPKKARPTPLLVEYAKGENAYSVFLGSDYPLMKIENEKKNGRKAVIIKNSFGNAFAPFVVPHYEEVYVIDYRYYKQALSALIKENGITDVIFITDTFLANADSHQKKLKKILK